MSKIRVLVVDDAVVIRRMLTEVVERDPQLELAGIAANGKIALQKIPQVNPDIVTLDVEMPEMDGITTLREIRKLYPTLPVIMCSTLTEKGASTTIEALQAGATDYVTKPANVGSVLEGFELMRTQLVPRIKTFCARKLPAEPKPALTPRVAPMLPRVGKPAVPRGSRIDAIGIGTSTGGPNALHTVFEALPRLDVPIFVVQHMPPLFTAMLAERLSKAGATPWHEGVDGMLVEPGHAYLAPGGHHMEVRRDGTRLRIALHDGPHENSCRPAVDVLFRSLATIYGSSVLGVVMTGMGQDGFRGAELMHDHGAPIVIQDEASSVVWGMPSYIAEAGIAAATVPLQGIALEISRRVRDSRRMVA